MHFAGIRPVDAPDPSEELRERVALLDLSVAGLVEQPHLEDWGGLGLAEQRRGVGDDAELEQVTVSRSYTLWRNSEDRGDPVNLCDLDEATRRTLDDVPPWPRPDWLVQRIERMRYPLLWEAVQTHRSAPTAGVLDATDRLVEHVQYALNNAFRDEHALPPMSEHSWATLVGVESVQADRPVIVDGVERPGFLLDTDPFVVGVAVELDDGRVLTSVVPRTELPLIQFAFVSDAPLGR